MIIDQDTAATILAAQEARRAERRRFLRLAGGATAVAGSLALLSACGSDDDDDDTPSPTPSPSPTATASTGQQEADALNFALNLEYLEAQFYAYAATGVGLSADLISGTGTAGAVTGGRAVTFADPIVGAYAREIAADERAHVAFLRSVLGSAAVAQPAINIDGGATGAFTAAARAAGLVGAAGTFDPYASDENFLLAAYLFEDVGVTAYKGASSILIYTAGYQEATSGLLSAEAYHAGLIRTTLYQKGIATPSLRTGADAISEARDALDGTAATQDYDQGISGTATAANITPADTNGLVFSRSPAQVLNVVYLNRAAVSAGGFFPAGVNGNVKTSAANG